MKVEIKYAQRLNPHIYTHEYRVDVNNKPLILLVDVEDFLKVVCIKPKSGFEQLWNNLSIEEIDLVNKTIENRYQ